MPGEKKTSKPLSMADIADAVGLSKNAVSMALRNDPRIPGATRRRIRSAADKLGYQYNPVVGELMAKLRIYNTNRKKSTIAIVNANNDPDALRVHPTIPVYIEGCMRRADKLGYSLDTFWIHDPDIRGERLAKVLHTRNIRGVVIVGLMDENHLPEHFKFISSRFHCVVTGVRTRNPTLSFACADHHALTLMAFEKSLELGYRRPGLVLDKKIDNLVDGRFTSGYLIGQRNVPRADWIHPFYDIDSALKEPGLFVHWVRKTKPDVVFTLYNVVKKWLESAKLSIPRDIGLIQLEWRSTHPDIAGMDQHNDITGETAINMVIEAVHHDDARPPVHPKATLISPVWRDGETVKRSSNGN